MEYKGPGVEWSLAPVSALFPLDFWLVKPSPFFFEREKA